MFELREYQKAAVDSMLEALMNKQAALCVAPTGSGKTEIMITVLKNFPDSKIVVVIKRINLVEQTAARFNDAGIRSSIYCSTLKQKNIGRVTITSVDSFYKVKEIVDADLVVLDEVHNFDETNEEARYSQTVNYYKAIGAKFLGFTATPFRSKGYIYGDEKLFLNIDYDIKMQELIEKGFLVKPLMKETKASFDLSELKTIAGDWSQGDLDHLVDDEEKLNRQVEEALLKLEGRKKIFWQATNCSHAERIRDRLNDASLVHTKDMNIDERRSELDRFESGSNRHCVFVSILSEGYNYPPADALVLLRPTKSPVLYVQTIGRVLRPFQDKKNALILDFGQVRKNCGPLDSPNIKDSKVKLNETNTWLCKSCMTYNDTNEQYCCDCGAPRPEGPGKPRSPESRTTLDSDNDELLSVWKIPEKVFGNVDAVTIEPYKSKAGNECVRINYLINDGTLWGNKTLSQYFPTDYSWSRVKAHDLVHRLGLSYPVSSKTLAQRKPKKIQYWYEGKFPKIGEIVW